VDRGPGGPRPVDKAHRFLHSKINPKINYPGNFAKSLLGFFVIKPQSPKFPRRHMVFKNISKYTPSHFPEIPYGSI
jgi:hypothetical protein